MSIFSAVFARAGGDWESGEVDLAEAGSIDDITDLMRDVAGADDPAAAEGVMVLLMEADDEWFGVVRVDDRADPRVFLSDARAVHSNPVAELLLDSGAIHEPEVVEGTGQKPFPEPGGDTELLSDLGTGSADLLALTLGEGLLPADALAVLAERAGFAEALDALRT